MHHCQRNQWEHAEQGAATTLAKRICEVWQLNIDPKVQEEQQSVLVVG